MISYSKHFNGFFKINKNWQNIVKKVNKIDSKYFTFILSYSNNSNMDKICNVLCS